MQVYNKCIAEHASLNDSQLCAVPRFTVHTEVKVSLCLFVTMTSIYFGADHIIKMFWWSC